MPIGPQHKPGKTLIITGTDTGVGKTVIACALAAAFRRRGLNVGVFKPVETGIPARDRLADQRDAALLKRYSGSRDPIEMIRPYRFRAPLAPWVAAEREGKRIDIARIRAIAQDIRSRHDVTLIETAGGLKVPITKRIDYAGLAAQMDVPILVVARLGLGTINHTLLTLEAAVRTGLRVIGYVLNHDGEIEGTAAQTNPRTLQRLTRLPLLGVFPRWRSGSPPARAAVTAERSLRIHTILNSL